MTVTKSPCVSVDRSRFSTGARVQRTELPAHGTARHGTPFYKHAINGEETTKSNRTAWDLPVDDMFLFQGSGLGMLH